MPSPLDSLVNMPGAGADVAREQLANPAMPLETPSDTRDRVADTQKQHATIQRVRAADLAARDIPTYRTPDGTVEAVRGGDGAALTKFDRRNNLAWDGSGNPVGLEYGEAGAPKLVPALDQAATKIDKAGNKYAVRPGMPWQWTGFDEDTKAAHDAAETTKEMNEQARLLGRKLTLDEHDISVGEKSKKALRTELVAAHPFLDTDEYKGADRATVNAALEGHYGSGGWFDSEETKAAKAAQKQAAIDKASQLFDLEENLTQLRSRATAMSAQRRGIIEPQIDAQLAAHGIQPQATPKIAATPALELAASAPGSMGNPTDQTAPTNSAPVSTSAVEAPISAFEEIKRGLVRGWAGTMSSLGGFMRMVGAEESGQAVSEHWDDVSAANPTQQGTFEPTNPSWYAARLPEVVAGFIPQLAAGIATGGASLPVQLTSFAVMGGGVMAGSVYNDAVADRVSKGEDEATARDGALGEAAMVGVIGSALEAIPGMVFFTKNPATRAVAASAIRRVTSRFAAGATAEGATEVLQSITEDLAKFGYRDDAAAFDDAANRYGAAGLLGAILGGGVDVALHAGQDAGQQQPPATTDQVPAGTESVADEPEAEYEGPIITDEEEAAPVVEEIVADYTDPATDDTTGAGTSEQAEEETAAVQQGPTETPAPLVDNGSSAIEAPEAQPEQTRSEAAPAQQEPEKTAGSPPSSTDHTTALPATPDGQTPSQGQTSAATGIQPEAQPEPEPQIASSSATDPEAATPESSLPPAAAATESSTEETSEVSSVAAPGERTPGVAQSAETASTEAGQTAAGGDSASATDTQSKRTQQEQTDTAAHEAATSPQNDLPEPTEAQKKAGNYKVGRTSVSGLPISIENPTGSTRSGTDAGGKPWSVTMQSHYGYIRKSEGKDGDHVDVFIKEGTPEDFDGPVYVVLQRDPKTGAFDEHKSVIGAASSKEAYEIYAANYAPGWKGYGGMKTFPNVAAFKEWLPNAKKARPRFTEESTKPPTDEQNTQEPVQAEPGSQEGQAPTGQVSGPATNEAGDAAPATGGAVAETNAETSQDSSSVSATGATTAQETNEETTANQSPGADTTGTKGAGDGTATPTPAPLAPNPEKTYDDLVRDTYAGQAARRKIGDLTPSLREDVMAFAKSGLPNTDAAVEKWLESRGVYGATKDLVRDIRLNQKLAKAIEAEQDASRKLVEREKGATKPAAKPATHETPEAAAKKAVRKLEAELKKDLKRLGVTRIKFGETSGDSGLETAGTEIIVDPAKAATSMAGAKDATEWLRQGLWEEAIHAQQHAFAVSQGFSSVQAFYDSVPDSAFSDAQMAKARSIYGSSPEPTEGQKYSWQHKAEAVRMILQGRWNGTVTEALYKIISDLKDFIRKSVSLDGASDWLKQHVAEMEANVAAVKPEAAPVVANETPNPSRNEPSIAPVSDKATESAARAKRKAAFQALQASAPIQFANGTITRPPPSPLAASSPLVAHHGTPHKILDNRFSLAKIGTGEGQQVFGWGLYFAERPGIAQHYKETLTPAPAVRWEQTGRIRYSEVDELLSDLAPHWRTKADLDALLNREKEKTDDDDGTQTPDAKNAELALEMLRSGELIVNDPPEGNLYSVELDVEKDELLDWDKDFRDQPKHVRDILAKMGFDPEGPVATETGQLVYRSLSKHFGGDREASMALAKAGIYGIKFADAPSRNKAEGTSNFVIFDENKIRVTHENGESVTLREHEAQQQKQTPLGASSPTQHKTLPKDKLSLFVEIAGDMIEEGITTPEAVYAEISELAGESTARSYSRATWRIMTGIADLPESVDWEAVFAPQQEAAAKPEAATKTPSRKVATEIAQRLASQQTISWQQLFEIADKAWGGTQAAGTYNVKDAYDALELGVNVYLSENREEFDPRGDAAKAKEVVTRIKRDILGRIPTQTKRTAEQDAMQQFSTPPHFSYVTNWVANYRTGDIMLEPSAGIGGISVYAQNAEVPVIANELSERRRGVIADMKPDHLTGENAEQLHAIFEPKIKDGSLPRPTVVVMNPPFSNSAKSGVRGDTMVGALHMEEALKLLPEGGRLVAIVGEGMALDAHTFRPWWARIQRRYNVRANIHVDGKNYTKYGTSFSNRLIVIDKTGPTASSEAILKGEVGDISELIPLLESIRNDRPDITQSPAKQGGNGAASATGNTEAGNPSPRPDAAPAPAANGTRPGRPGRRPGSNANPAGKPAAQSDPETAGAVASPARVDGAADPAGRSGTDLQPAVSGLTVAKQEKKRVAQDNADDVFAAYQPSKVSIPGAIEHPADLVESAAMASVPPPDPTYTPNLPSEIVTSGALSEAQIENLVYAGQAHGQMLETGERRGYFIGDGTGVGKGRQISGIILDNLRQGRTKAIWVSKNNELAKDARRDASDLGIDPKTIRVMKDIKKGKPIEGDGILFTSYDTLKGSHDTITDTIEEWWKKLTGKEAKSRIEQIANWVGKDFDGVIAFDEAHMAGNAIEIKGKRGTKKASKNGIAVVDLQKALPKARVVYVSATGATEVENLSYADRLGIWGPNTPFPTKREFFQKISAGGISAMEIVARDMKAMGLYLARSISYKGVEFDRLTQTLTPEQSENYDKIAEGWQVVLSTLDESMAASGANESPDARSSALSAFWSAQQRFFNQVLTAMQMPILLDDMRKQLDAGNSLVLQIVNTNEASQNREIARRQSETAEGEKAELDDMDMSPKDILLQYIQTQFPTYKYEQVSDPNNPEKAIWVPAKDSEGNFIQDPESVAARDRLLDQISTLTIPDNPLEQIMSTFGAENVAEVTGRSQRVVQQLQDDGKRKTKIENRSPAHRQVEADDFQNGKRRILVFSAAGGTGFSFHASIRAKNQQKRMHYLVQAGWRADAALQGFGRTHRSAQKQAPFYKLVETNIPGHKRFISTIARRLAQLGALTTGDRKSSGQGMFTEADNLEGQYAEDALRRLIFDLHRDAIPTANMTDFARAFGFMKREVDQDTGEIGERNMLVDPKTGGLNEGKLPPVPQFLNRILASTLEKQTLYFDLFMARLESRIERSKEDGTYDPGTQVYRAERIEKVSDDVLYTHPGTAADTRMVEVNAFNKNVFTPFDDVDKLSSAKTAGYVQNKRSKRIYALKESENDKTLEDGRVVKTYRRIGTREYDSIPRMEVTAEKFDRITEEEAKAIWETEIKEAPQENKKTVHFLVGAMLPIWDRIQLPTPKIFRFTTTEGESMLGVQIPEKEVFNVRKRMGAKSEMGADDAFKQVLDNGARMTLANGWTIRRAYVSRENRIEVTGLNYNQAQDFTGRMGGVMERIQYQSRYFIPTDEAAGVEVMKKVLAQSPITDMNGDVLAASAPTQNQEEDSDASGIRNRITDADRGRLDLAPRVRPLVRQFGSVWDDAMAIIADDPEAGSRLVDSLLEDMRALDSDTDVALLAYEKIRRDNEVDKANDALRNSSEAAQAHNAARMTRALEKYQEVLDAAAATGTDTARALNARRLLVNKDFTLARMLGETRAANGGQPLSETQVAEITKLHEEAETLRKALAEMEARALKAEGQSFYNQMVQGLNVAAKEAAKAGVRHIDFLKDQGEKAMARVKARRAKAGLNASDPASILAASDPESFADEAMRGGYHVANGANTLEAFTEKMVADFGEEIRPDAEALFEKSKEYSKAMSKLLKSGKAGSATPKTPKTPKKVLAEVTTGVLDPKLVYDLARAHVQAGVRGMENVMNAVHKDLAPMFDGLTIREVRDAFSGYGKVTFPSKEADKVTLREIRELARLTSQLEDAQARIVPLRTGPQRDKATAEARALQKRISDTMRRLGLKTTNAAAQKATALDAAKTRLRNEIEELELAMASKTPRPSGKAGLDYDTEARKLKLLRDARKKQYDAIFANPALEEAQRIEAALKAVRASISRLDEKLRNGKLTPEGRQPVRNDALDALRNERDAMQRLVSELRNAEKPPVDAEAAQLKRDKATIAARIKALEDKIARDDYAPAPKREPVSDKEKTDLQFKYAKVREKYLQGLFETKLKARNKSQKLKDGIREALNTSRALMTSLDLSALGRQGGFIAFSRPIRTVRAVPAMFHAMMSERGQFEIEESIRERPNASLYQRAKLDLADYGNGPAVKLTKLEEAFMSRWIQKMPRWLGGGLVRGSARAYTTLLNVLRADAFDAMVATLSASGNPTIEEAKAVANYVNVATGRGNMGAMAQAAVGLNTVFFAPRYVLSRFQLITAQPLRMQQSGRTRKLIAIEYGRYLAGITTVFALGALAQDDDDEPLELDPRSTNFGKIRFGNTRLDPLSGLAQVTTFSSRMVTRSMKTGGGEVRPIHGKIQFGKQDLADVVFQFTRTKLSPAFGGALNVMSGTNLVGEPVTPVSQAREMVVPLSAGEIIEVMKEHNVPKGTALSMLAIFGMGINTYEPKKPKAVASTQFTGF